MDIADRIRKLRGNQTRERFAQELGVSAQTLYKYESRTGKVSLEFVEKICKLLSVRYEWLIAGEEPMRKEEHAEGEKPGADEVIGAKRAFCPRCARLEQRLDAAKDTLVETLQANVGLITEIGESRLENMKLSQELERTRQTCREYAAALKEAEGAALLFEEQRNIASSDSTSQI